MGKTNVYFFLLYNFVFQMFTMKKDAVGWTQKQWGLKYQIFFQTHINNLSHYRPCFVFFINFMLNPLTKLKSNKDNYWDAKWDALTILIVGNFQLNIWNFGTFEYVYCYFSTRQTCKISVRDNLYFGCIWCTIQHYY